VLSQHTLDHAKSFDIEIIVLQLGAADDGGSVTGGPRIRSAARRPVAGRHSSRSPKEAHLVAGLRGRDRNVSKGVRGSINPGDIRGGR
jgi:hypothetical protein